MASETARAQLVLLVDNTSDDHTKNTCGAAANDCSLRGALQLANAQTTDVTINFEPAVFSTAQTITLNGDSANRAPLVVSQAVGSSGKITINGPGAHLLTIDAARQSRVFTTRGTHELIGLKITGGRSGWPPPGQNFTDQYDRDGGGIYHRFGELILRRCWIDGNDTWDFNSFPQLINTGGGTTTRYTNGGGIYNFGGTVTLVDSTLSNNRTTSGVYNDPLASNGFSRGGGIYSRSFFDNVTTFQATVNVINCTVSGNDSDYGGGIFSQDGAVNLTHATVTQNVTRFVSRGDGIMPAGATVLETDKTLTLANSIVSGNTSTHQASGQSCPGCDTADIQQDGAPVVSMGYNYLAFVQNFMSGDMTGNIYGSQPSLGNLASNGVTVPTRAPNPGSPVIDKGTSFGYATDQRGSTRTLDLQSVSNASDGTDIGAVEYNAFDTVAPTVSSFANNLSARLYVGNAVTYTMTFSENVYGVEASDFNNAGTASVTIGNPNVSGGVVTLPVTVNSAGTLQLRLPAGATVFDDAGNALAPPVADPTVLTAYLRPTITSITNNVNGGPINFGAVVTYTINFSTSVTVVDAADFENAGTGMIVVGTPAVNANVVTLPVTTTSIGTLRLRIPNGAVITDLDGSALATPVLDSTTIAVQSGSVAHHVVDTTSSDAALTVCSDSPNDCSLAGAINAANASLTDDLITFDPAHFNVPRTILTASVQLFIDNASRGLTTVRGPGAQLLTISAAHTSRVLQVNDGSSVIISGLTLTEGGVPSGACLNNYAPGGGIYSTGDLTLFRCAVVGNAGQHGAGIHTGVGTLTLVDCLVANNTNHQNGEGNGIKSTGGVVNVINTTITGNVSDTNFCGSSFRTNGGGIYNASGSTVNLLNATITSNGVTTRGSGGGVYNLGTVTARNSIVANNYAIFDGPADFSGTLISRGCNLVKQTSQLTVVGDATGNILGQDPNLGPLQENGGAAHTQALQPGSPALDAAGDLTTLNAAVDASQTSIQLADATGFAPDLNLLLEVDAEQMLITGRSGNTLTVVRGAHGTAAAAHASGAGVNLAFDQRGPGFSRNTKWKAAAASRRVDIGAFELSAALRFVNNPITAVVGAPVVDLATATGVSPAGGTFSGPGVDTAAGTFDPSVNPTGVYALTYSVNDGFGGVNSAGFTLNLIEAGNLTVSIASDVVSQFDGATSLREAIAFAQGLGGAQTITFAAALAGQTVTLSTGWLNADDSPALRVTGNITVQGPATAPGVTLAIAQGVQKRHFYVEPFAELTLVNLTLTGGNVPDFGGAIWNAGALAVRRCTISGNSAGAQGGAIQSNVGTVLTVENSTIIGNTSGNVGSAIATGASPQTFRSLTITNNTGPNGPLYLYETPATLVNSIVAGNSNDAIATAGPGAFDAQSSNNIFGASSAPGLTNDVNANILGATAGQLNLGTFANHGGSTATIALQPGSIAIDAGVAITGLTTDQRGITRPQGSAPDVGAFELVPPAASIPIIAPLGGVYESSVPVTISSTSPGAGVRYTLDGSTPSASHGTVYSEAITLTRTSTIKAIACGPGWIDSAVASVEYTVLRPARYWRHIHGLPSDGSQDLATPAGDGVPNLLKYAFNMAPNAGDLLVSNTGVLPASGTSGLPRVWRDEEGQLVIEFVRRKAKSQSDVTYVVETGADLTVLQPLSLTGAQVASIDERWERVTVTDPTVTPSRFGRVRVHSLPVYSNDFTGGAGSAALRGSAIWVNDAIQLTHESTGGQSGAAIFEGAPAGAHVNGFTARFKMAIGPHSGAPADGVSFAVGDLGTGAWGEGGPGTSHNITVGFDTYNNATPESAIGIHLWVNGTHISANATNPYTDSALVPVDISFSGSAVTVKFNGTTIFDSVAVSGFTFQPGDKYGMGGRTGGFAERALVDDIEIITR